MYEYGEKHKVLGYVWLGDIKSRYNPIDGRCLNFISDQIERFCSVYILLGNHDRFGLHSNESWLTTLGKAGAYLAKNYKQAILFYSKALEQEMKAPTLETNVWRVMVDN